MPKYDNKRDAEEIFMTGMIVGSTAGLIENSEKVGQTSMVQSSDLPIDMGRVTQEQVESGAGIRFGEPVNDLFIAVTLPEGWRKEATDHSMHSDLLDEKGRKRAGIFYKAAFYDRKASMHFNPFWRVENDYKTRSTFVLNADGEEFCHHVELKNMFTGDGEAADRACEAWLDENHPEWRDPFAYWD